MTKVDGFLPFRALDAVTTAPTVSDITDLQGVYSQVGVYADVSGGPSFSLLLEGSIDNVNFYGLGSAVTSSGLYVATGTYLVRYVKVFLSSLSGGSSPSVTAWVAVN